MLEKLKWKKERKTEENNGGEKESGKTEEGSAQWGVRVCGKRDVTLSSISVSPHRSR